MTRRLLLIECVGRRQLPSLPWALLSASLGQSVAHDRLQVHEFALSSLVREPSVRGWGLGNSRPGAPGVGNGRGADLPGAGLPGADPYALVYLDTRFPVREAAAFVLAVAPVPVVLYGPYALDRFEQLPVRGAMIGPARQELCALGLSALRGPSSPTGEDYRSLDRFLLREGSGHEERWSVTSIGPWPPAESVIQPFDLSFDWDYIGPRRREDPARPDRAAPWWPEPVSDVPSAVDRHVAKLPLPGAEDALSPPRFDPRWTEASVPLLHGLLERDPDAELFRFEARPRSESIALLVEQVRVLARLGHRSLEVLVEDPFPILLPSLRELGRADLRPQEVVLSPSIQVLRRSEGIRQELLGAAQLCARLTLRDIEFSGFDDRSLRLRGLNGTHWDQRWVARLLTELDGSFGGQLSATRGHRIALFDPWIRPRELLESLVAIDEDAPFLKAHVHPGASLRIPSRHGPRGRRIDDAGLLTASRGATSGWAYEFADPRMASFHELAQRGLGPLVESVGRLRLPGEARQHAIIEARFRWFRQLAELFETDPEGSAGSWGKVLASVTRQVAVDMRRG